MGCLLSSCFISSATDTKIRIRDATINDLDALTDIAVAVIPQEPQTLYQYPFGDKYPKDVQKYTRLETKQFLKDDIEGCHYVTMLAEAKSMDKEKWTIISLASWEVSAVEYQETTEKESLKEDLTSNIDNNESDEYDDSSRRDADFTRIRYYQDIIDNARNKYLMPQGKKDSRLPYIHLTRLATLPEWQRHGAGTKLSRWGMELAEKHSLDIGLFATPSGRTLYRELGFTEMADIVVQMDGEDESVSMTCMRLYASKD